MEPTQKLEEGQTEAFLEQRAAHVAKSAHMRDDAESRELEEDKLDNEEPKVPIQYTILGSEDCPFNVNDEEIEFSMSFRIPKIENLEQCLKLKVRYLN